MMVDCQECTRRSDCLIVHDALLESKRCPLWFQYMATLVGEKYPGDIVEIGCYTGKTTVRLAQAARQLGRKVIAIDSWLPGTQDCQGHEYEQFKTRTAGHRGEINVWRMRSDAFQVKKVLRATPLCFAYIDGEHSYKAVLGDLLNVAHTSGLIVVDDMNQPEVHRAVMEFLQSHRMLCYYRRGDRQGFVFPESLCRTIGTCDQVPSSCNREEV